MICPPLGPSGAYDASTLAVARVYDINDCDKVARAFFYNIKNETPHPENSHFNVRFGGTDTIVWTVHCNTQLSEMERPLYALAVLLKNPPIRVD